MGSLLDKSEKLVFMVMADHNASEADTTENIK